MSDIFREAFIATMDEFGIRAKDLSENSTVSRQGISLFLNGKSSWRHDTLGAAFQAFNPEQKAFFISYITKVWDIDDKGNTGLLELVKALDPNNDIHRKYAGEVLEVIRKKFLS
ncbi:MAG: hypothetical protein F6K50_20245 [Moorea sp. SIO3I7]|uniref:hypothetical protein n=1 Tax=Moorena sp. SIO3I6 TaxID=2607831 RepID=UPI0013C68C59|nr:hypothetical protein [Moorena sp. SIO3I6]NEN97766.1 hypothetical protein [Moorena sp. SIO3I7]NEO43346.1 hypothetical protein [Moorena sp. SIO4A3]NEP24299.1 hypothetical protein [Moorena sp. SIO3I6]